MSDLTPNVPVQAEAGPVTTRGAEVVSFDDLDTALEVAPKAGSKKTGDKPKEEKAEEKKDKDSTHKESKKDVSSKDEDKQGKEKKDHEQENSEKISRKIKARQKDQEIDLDELAEFEAKVDGKPTKATLKQLLDDFSGRTAWQSRFGELSKKQKEVEKSDFEVQAKNRKIVDTLKEISELSSNPVAVAYKIAELTGQDGANYWKQIEQGLQKSVLEFMKMTPEERQAFEAKQEAEFYKGQFSKQKEEKNQEQSRREMQLRVEQLLESSGIEATEYENALTQIESLIDANPQAMGIDKKQITPEFVLSYHKNLKMLTDLDSVLGSFELPEKTLAFLKEELREMWAKSPDLTADEIKEIIKEVYGKTPKSALKVKAEKADKVSSGTSKTRSMVSPQNEPLTFDDL
jgi:hypothetical protein